eukprot:gene22792-9213_t
MFDNSFSQGKRFRPKNDDHDSTWNVGGHTSFLDKIG